MRVLVTGGTGFIGSHLVRQLVHRGEDVRVLVRASSNCANIADLPVTKVPGELRDPASLEQAVQDCELVYHCAADYRLWAREPQELIDTNVTGTANLLQACRKARVRRTVVTSSVSTVGIPANGSPGDESTFVDLNYIVNPYKLSKLEGEKVALEFAAQGDDVVVVNPSTPVGEQDIRPTETGKIISNFLNGKMPAFVDTGLNLVDVEDVAAGHILAAEKGVSGRRYILGGQDMSLKEILQTLAEISGLPAPRVQLPLWFAYLVGAIDTFVCGKLLRRAPSVPLDGVKMARKHMYFSSRRAEQELGYRSGPVRPALERAVQWFVEHNYCPKPPKLSLEPRNREAGDVDVSR